MALGFPSDFKELVRSRTDLVELIGESVALEPERGGRGFKGLCPFHDDHNPSLTVSPERQSYKCWSCGEGGDCYSFVMKTQALEFPAAVRLLAELAGIEIPREHTGGNGQGGDRKKRLLTIMEWAENEFHRFLLDARAGGRARDYLAGRGFSAEMISTFRLGFHPNDWNWLLGRTGGRFQAAEMVAAGLMGERPDGSGYYDNFTDRVLFPIRDPQGRAVAFGGRILPDCDRADAAKYWNGPDTQLFSKSSLLYGFDVAREAIRRSKTAVVVEGYTDCITLHQHGLGNVVATLGTALTDLHVSLLKRFARKVVLLYDGDEAGQRAAERALAMFLAQKVDLRILTLPPGIDPTDYIASHGADALREQVENAVEAWDHKLQLSIKQNGLDSIDGRDRVLSEMLELMSVVPQLTGDAREDILLHRLAREVGASEQKVRQMRRQATAKKSRRGQHMPEFQEPADLDTNAGPLTELQNNHERQEFELLEIIFSVPETIETIRREVDLADFTQQHLRTLLQVCFDLGEQGVEPSYERVTSALEDMNLKRLALWIDEEARNKGVAKKLETDEALAAGGRPHFLAGTIHNLKWRREEASHEQTKGQMTQLPPMGDGLDEDAKALLRRQTEFHQQRATKKSIQ